MKAWIGLFIRSPKAKLACREATGLPVPTYHNLVVVNVVTLGQSSDSASKKGKLLAVTSLHDSFLQSQSGSLPPVHDENTSWNFCTAP